MFVVCGEALWDLYGADAGDELRFDARPGGSPFNVAIGLARLDIGVALFAGLSRDRLGARLCRILSNEGVRTDMVVRPDRPTTLSLVDLAPDGAPAYAFYGTDTADRAIERDDLPVFRSEVRGVHVGSYCLVAEPVGSSLLALLQREAGHRLVTLDPNVRLNVEPDLKLWRDRLAACIRLSDVVKVSAEDLDLLYPGRPVAAIAADWLGHGPGLVVVTRGADGAEAHGRFGRIDAPGHEAAVVDTVGAGDSFMAGLIAGLSDRAAFTRERVEALEDAAVADLLGFAAAAAAITCGRRGADPPRRGDLPAAARPNA